jgi:hypothetical protein
VDEAAGPGFRVAWARTAPPPVDNLWKLGELDTLLGSSAMIG